MKLNRRRRTPASPDDDDTRKEEESPSFGTTQNNGRPPEEATSCRHSRGKDPSWLFRMREDDLGGRPSQKGARERLQAMSGCNRRFWFCVLLLLFILLGIALTVVGLGTYFRYEMRKKESQETRTYLKNLINQVNSATDVRWKAKFNPFGSRKKSYDYKSLKNTTAIKEYIAHLERFFASEKMHAHLREIQSFPASDLPDDFDAREKWPSCPSIHFVPNQGGCGSCFAVSAAGVASDRSCIQSNGTIRHVLSSEDILGCCAVCGNCYGGDPLKAMVYWAIEGVVTGSPDGCKPYTPTVECGIPCDPVEYPNAESYRKCTRRCQHIYYKNPYEEDKFSGSIAYTLYPRTMSTDQAGSQRVMMKSVVDHLNQTSHPLTPGEIRDIIKKELFISGPTTMAFPVTEEFLHYDSGIFHPYPEENFEDRIVYWHVVRLIGWGTDENGKHYWTAVNSFGSQWGENGYFRIDTSLLEKFGLEYETGLL